VHTVYKCEEAGHKLLLLAGGRLIAVLLACRTNSTAYLSVVQYGTVENSRWCVCIKCGGVIRFKGEGFQAKRVVGEEEFATTITFGVPIAITFSNCNFYFNCCSLSLSLLLLPDLSPHRRSMSSMRMQHGESLGKRGEATVCWVNNVRNIDVAREEGSE
jgi:hypothetical protein